MRQTEKSGAVLPIGYKTRLDDKLKLVLDSMPIGVTWARLEDGATAYTNRKFTELTGYELEDIPTIDAMFAAFYDDPEDRRRATEGVQPFLRKTNLEEVEFPPLEVTIRCRDGGRKTIALGLVVLPSAGWMVATYLDLTDRKERERLMEQLARQDPLTGLLNRRSFDMAVEESARNRRSQQTLILAICDLDGFKLINDNFGHATGDEVLQAAAQRLAGAFRAGDTLARVGGDEFAAVMLTEDPDTLTETLRRRIADAFAKPVAIGGHKHAVGVSVGFARIPQQATTPLEVYRLADADMYRQKAARKAAQD